MGYHRLLICNWFFGPIAGASVVWPPSSSDVGKPGIYSGCPRTIGNHDASMLLSDQVIIHVISCTSTMCSITSTDYHVFLYRMSAYASVTPFLINYSSAARIIHTVSSGVLVIVLQARRKYSLGCQFVKKSLVECLINVPQAVGPMRSCYAAQARNGQQGELKRKHFSKPF